MSRGLWLKTGRRGGSANPRNGTAAITHTHLEAFKYPAHSPQLTLEVTQPAGCLRGKKTGSFHLFTLQIDDNASSERWPTFSCQHVALIVRLGESAQNRDLSIHLVSTADSQQKNTTLGQSELRFHRSGEEKLSRAHFSAAAHHCQNNFSSNFACYRQ